MSTSHFPIDLIIPAAISASEGASHEDDAALLISTVNEIITLSRQLLAQASRATPEMVKSLREIHLHLSAIVSEATGDGQHLPETEAIAPNQPSCPETAECMGMKRSEKHRDKDDSVLTAELIGQPNRKRKRGDEDPHRARKQFRKDARPDAHSASVTTGARAAAELTLVHSAAPPASLPARQASPMHVPLHAPMHALHYTHVPPLSLPQSAPSSFGYYPQPYIQYPSYPVLYIPMYYPPPT